MCFCDCLLEFGTTNTKKTREVRRHLLDKKNSQQKLTHFLGNPGRSVWRYFSFSTVKGIFIFTAMVLDLQHMWEKWMNLKWNKQGEILESTIFIFMHLSRHVMFIKSNSSLLLICLLSSKKHFIMLYCLEEAEGLHNLCIHAYLKQMRLHGQNTSWLKRYQLFSHLLICTPFWMCHFSVC